MRDKAENRTSEALLHISDYATNQELARRVVAPNSFPNNMEKEPA
jgi:hypothetical protein